jgi:hypothetical protein
LGFRAMGAKPSILVVPVFTRAFPCLPVLGPIAKRCFA